MTYKMMALATALCALFAAQADAAFDKSEAKCRKAISKSMGKALKIGDNVIAKCHKSRNAGKIPEPTDCNELSPAEADDNQKFAKAKQKLEAAVDKKCIAAGIDGDVLAEYVSCPEPCATETGVSNPLADYGELGACLACLAGDLSGAKAEAVLGTPAAPLTTKEEEKCHAAIAKGYGKYVATILKERAKCQDNAEKKDGAGGLDDTTCASDDPKGKISAALVKAQESVAGRCTGVDLTNLDSCASTNAGDLNACLETECNMAAATMLSAHYELDPTVCPVALTVRSRAGTGIGGSTTVTKLDAGWNGIGHGQDVVDQSVLELGLSCPSSEPPCGSCTITGIASSEVQSGALTRCREDASIECSNPFGTDPVCPGGQECSFFQGPPLPLSASSTPVCVLNRAEIDLAGSMVVESGDLDIDLELRAVVHTGISQTKPCPQCAGTCTAKTTSCGNDLDCNAVYPNDPTFCEMGKCVVVCNTSERCQELSLGSCPLDTPQDGVRDGICTGGARDRLPCDVQGLDATFGNTSLDCPPVAAQNVSGQGLDLDLSLTTGTSTLPFGTPCDFPFAAEACACAVCSLDTTIPCNSDAECLAVAAGTCTSNGGGPFRLRNGCSDRVCTDLGGEVGECQSGPDVSYCDGHLRANGDGFLSCNTNADCSALDPACNDQDCGNCTLVEPRSCFLDPIVAVGTADPEAPVIGATFCVPVTSSSGINTATGLPGASRVFVQLETTPQY